MTPKIDACQYKAFSCLWDVIGRQQNYIGDSQRQKVNVLH